MRLHSYFPKKIRADNCGCSLTPYVLLFQENVLSRCGREESLIDARLVLWFLRVRLSDQCITLFISKNRLGNVHDVPASALTEKGWIHCSFLEGGVNENYHKIMAENNRQIFCSLFGIILLHLMASFI